MHDELFLPASMYDELVLAARSARKNAYCRYSRFAVGAALLCKDGTIYTGCNVENASYSLGICAERTAFCKAAADGYRKGDFAAIAIAGGEEGMPPEQPCYPCGACRQVMAEFCGDDFEVILADRVYTLAELLPYRFALD